ncbi:MAG TPA: sigma-70 family RNA polymerase sigma factor [Chitinophagaceae bacterium]|nr:sigma-70 family RNA polymerase sigma factor [Chitinophagaceae bacterium]
METKKLSKETLTREVLDNLSALQRFAFSLCQDKQEAEELVSETVVKAFEKGQQLNNEQKMKQWLFRILNNIFISNYRKARHRATVDLNELISPPFSLFDQVGMSTFTDGGTPENMFINKITKEKIYEAINNLPEEFRVTLILCDVNDFSYAEIATITQVAIGTVRSRIARARNLLQRRLWRYAGELGITVKEKYNGHVCTCGKDDEKPAITITV